MGTATHAAAAIQVELLAAAAVALGNNPSVGSLGGVGIVEDPGFDGERGSSVASGFGEVNAGNISDIAVCERAALPNWAAVSESKAGL